LVEFCLTNPNLLPPPLWTDSAIVLHWLSKQASQLTDRFVANRIQSIHDHLPLTVWRHVPTSDNPADMASRGVPAAELITSSQWWSGPPWLSQPPDRWPVTRLSRPKESTTVLSISVAYSMDTQQSRFLDSLWERLSSFHHLTRVISWIRRFTHNSKKNSTNSSPLI